MASVRVHDEAHKYLLEEKKRKKKKIPHIIDSLIAYKEEEAPRKIADKDAEIQQLKAELEAQQPKHEDAGAESSSKNATFNVDWVKTFCPYPYVDPNLHKHVCGNKKCPIPLPKYRILTDEICDLCYEEQQSKSLHIQPVNPNPTTEKKQGPTKILQNHEDGKGRLATEIFLKAMSGQEPFNGLLCPHECRMPEENMQVFYCGKDLKRVVGDRTIRYRQIYNVDRCRQCISLHETAKRINARATKPPPKGFTSEYGQRPRIIMDGDIPWSAYG